MATSIAPSPGNSHLSSSLLQLLFLLVFTCYLHFPQKLVLSRVASKNIPSHLPALRPWHLEGALPAKPRLRLACLNTPKASVFSEAVFMATYKLDTDCLICIGARHRDAQNLAGVSRHKGERGWVLQEGGDGAHVRIPVGIAAGRAIGVYWNPKSFRSKL